MTVLDAIEAFWEEWVRQEDAAWEPKKEMSPPQRYTPVHPPPDMDMVMEVYNNIKEVYKGTATAEHR